MTRHPFDGLTDLPGMFGTLLRLFSPIRAIGSPGSIGTVFDALVSRFLWSIIEVILMTGNIQSPRWRLRRNVQRLFARGLRPLP